MIYAFECHCGNRLDVVRHHSESNDPQDCPVCSNRMFRDYSFTQGRVERETGFIPAFDREVRNKHDLDRAKKEYADTHNGSEAIEVGNERAAMKKLKPKLHDYKITRNDIREALQDG